MNSFASNEDHKKNLEQEFHEFLVQKIDRAGGSIQFQFLFGCLLQELRFEIRDAFGKTKSDVMKFLRGHPKLFKVDPKGVVTLVTSAVEDNNSSDENYEKNDESNKNVLPKIVNGEGTILKLSAKYGIINVMKPFKTCVYFTPYEYNGKSDCLFVELDLERGTTVCFNAIPGLNEYEIEYRATKVWRNCPINEQLPSRNDTGNKFNNVAEERISRKDPEHKSQSIIALEEVNKSAKDVLENESGKILPYRNGAVIQFGKGYSQIADGKSCRFYLYGSEICGLLDLEFSEGDEVFFDAIKTEKGWDAMLVWVGEKPNVKNFKDYASERKSTNYNEPSKYSKPLETKEKKTSAAFQKNEKLDRSNTAKIYGVKQKPVNSRSSSAKTSNKKSKIKIRSTVSERDPMSVNKNKNAQKYEAKSRNNSNFNNDNKCYTLSSRERISAITFESNQDTSDDDSEFQIPSNRKFLKECEYPVNKSDDEFSNNGKRDCKVTSANSEENRNINSSIRKFYDVEGRIIQLFCKFAIVTSLQVSEDLDFVLGVFFLNGKSIEEQNVIDLKEVINVGDIVKFNYFEIVDNEGIVYRKITVAWIGPQPNVQESTPEDYIKECALSVSVNSELDDNYIEKKKGTRNVPSSANSTSSNNTTEFFSPCNSPALDEVTELNELSDDPLEYSLVSQREKSENDFDTSESKIQRLTVSEMIMERLRTSGCISSRSEANMHIVVEDIINTVLNESNIKSSNPQCLTCAKDMKSKTSINKKTSSVKVQTIITGEIVATKRQDWLHKIFKK